ncbi:hypothetical protein A1O7_09745 [Cladophialophora yegresii CBS 114405]|uniref:Uncharacterized protein n=1 Tax=Cladophialophora yegresii CBS 114405 TaxID=1182544 RepID=W9VQK3_9EURO|nr:uncharacterized protein A1O7_09745 [Cladophialophora yegresii CBS 114405]EXJ54406.1 hypothetical protein A1O7_09745 [Cladophialophora yegresii CBS 114405]
MSFSNISPSLPLRQRVPDAPAKPSSLVDDPVFNLLYAGNETTLRQFLENPTPLTRDDNLANVYRYVKAKGEPGPRVQYDHLPYSLSAMRNFLQGSSHGKQLLSFFKGVLQTQGGYIVTAAEMAAFEIFVKMTEALFIHRNDNRLREHVISVVPEAQYTMPTYTGHERQFFHMYSTNMLQQLRDANATATRNLLDLKNSKEFARKHRQLLKANELHESKLSEIRRRAAKRKAEHKAKLQRARARNDATLNRQMGMAGLTSHTPHVERSVVEYVQDTTGEFFPRFDDGEANGEELMLDSLGLSF